MARNDLLITLVKAGMAGDRAKVKASAEAIAAEERALRHTIFADRLIDAAAVKSSPIVRTTSQPAAPLARDGVIQVIAQTRLDELSLSSAVRLQVQHLIDEHRRADLLRAEGIEPRHRILLSGPPGNGKTTLAEAIAEALALDFFVVRYEAIIGSLLGETNSRLKKLFDQVRGRPCVLFFDEFDTIGKERGDENETGEIKRVVSNLLLQIDALPSNVVTIAATNHAELLDRAVWRRFQIKLPLPSPTQAELRAYLKRVIGPWGKNEGISAATLAKLLHPSSYSEARDFCLNVRRRQILERGDRQLKSIVEEELKLWQARVTPDSHAVRPKQAAAKARSAGARSADKGEETSAPVSGGIRKGPTKRQARSEVRSASRGTRKSRQRDRPS